MKRHNPDIIDAIKMDRANGSSISVLMKKYSLPKTTIWHHVQGIEMSEESRQLIRSYQGGSKIVSQREWRQAEKEASAILAHYAEAVSWPVLIAALYWSEGTKRNGFVFTNTDGSMIKVFLKILRRYLHVKNEDLDILIRTCSPMDIELCKEHWGAITDMPKAKIRINHDDKHNRSKTQFGMCRITLKKGGYKLKLMHCLIRELVVKMACA